MAQAPLTQEEYWNGRVGAEWAAQAARIDAMLAPLTSAGLGALQLKAGERVLDIGCGGGATTLEIARRVGDTGAVTGVDLSRPLLQLARERAASRPHVRFVEADAGAAAFEGAPFDAAFSRFGVMFFDDPVKAFAHLRGALRPEGRIVFVCWRAAAENLWAMTPVEAIRPMLKAPPTPPDPDAPGPFAFASAAKIVRILEQSGWREASLDAWDGPVTIGADAREAAAFVMKIGPCSRLIADQELDAPAAIARIEERLAQHRGADGVALPAACWIVRAAA